jgi:homoserine dehydrogenase
MSDPSCRIALLGFGTVGSALARRLVRGSHVHSLALTHICDRRAAEKRRRFEADHHRAPLTDPPLTWTDSFENLLTSDADVIVEAIGGVDPAVDWIRAALRAGKSVVTSNKQAMALHGPSLRALAARQGRQLRFEAAVGGAMPIVRAVGGGLAGDRIQRLVAILNGTTNVVLSRLEAGGVSFGQALEEAQSRGYAEADPSSDIDGIDARAKLAILCAVAFGLRVDPREIEAHTCARLTSADFAAARGRGETIRQLAYAAYERSTATLTAWVAPAHVKAGSLFARTTGAGNAAVITGEFAGDIQITGAGAGGDATAVAIVSDLLAIAKDRAAIEPAPRLSRPAAIAGLTAIGGDTARRGAGDIRWFPVDTVCGMEAV